MIHFPFDNAITRTFVMEIENFKSWEWNRTSNPKLYWFDDALGLVLKF